MQSRRGGASLNPLSQELRDTHLQAVQAQRALIEGKKARNGKALDGKKWG